MPRRASLSARPVATGPGFALALLRGFAARSAPSPASCAGAPAPVPAFPETRGPADFALGALRARGAATVIAATAARRSRLRGCAGRQDRDRLDLDATTARQPGHLVGRARRIGRLEV